ncbi:Nuclear control of ATPase protein 2 [Termitomyces sp. J132]|nr:Nuclear control of ATPase protein 2 [Termitomyces sp. J132]
MPSAFAQHLIKPLVLSQRPPNVFSTSQTLSSAQADGGTKEKLQNSLSALNQSLSHSLVVDTIESLTEIEKEKKISASAADFENDLLRDAIISKLLVGLYAEEIDSHLSQATEAETEAEWWADIERSRWNLALYLLQTTPSRLLNLTRVVIQTLRVHNLPVTFSTFTPTSLRSLFPLTDPQRLTALQQALFPHLRHQTLSVKSSAILNSSFTLTLASPGNIFAAIWRALEPLLVLTRLPIEMIRQECAFKRQELEKIRDQRAAALGYLAHMRPTNELLALSTAVFTTQKMVHQRLLESKELCRPPRLILMWPRLLLLPPLCIYILRSAYTSRASLAELAFDAKATAEGFVRGWLLDPLKDVIKTVRAGSQDGVIVQKEGIAADLASLERMTLSLAKDQLNYDAEQLANLSNKVRLGDLTPVLQIYEEDIRSPLKSAVTGTLLRSVFIQVQKAKVDIDQTLAGIDKLLKSQELTFAFVGVAPAFGVVYLLGGTLMALWSGGRGIGKYGGKRTMCGVWSAMRRTERLLIAQPKYRHNKTDGTDSSFISPLTSGLLLLSVARLRTLAEKHLPRRSRLREGFLEDVGDLENPDLGRIDKIKVIERMWRCWGESLGWGRIAVEGTSSR